MEAKVELGILHTITAGGQTWTHRVRMLRQVIKVSMIMALTASLISWGILISRLPYSYFVSSFYYVKAEIAKYFLKSIEVNRELWAQLTHIYLPSDRPWVNVDQVIRVTYPHVMKLVAASIDGLRFALTIFGSSFLLVLLFFLYRGFFTKSKNHISGQKTLSPFRVKCSLILKRQASDISLGGVPLVKDAETQHFLITGGTGSGKTNCLHHLLSQIKKRGDRAIILDTTGVFIDRYYRKNQDKLLNPFHEYSEQWSPWSECREKFDYDALAESLIPQSYSENENYWRGAARNVVSSLIEKLADSKKTSELTEWLLYRPLSELCELVSGTR